MVDAVPVWRERVKGGYSRHWMVKLSAKRRTASARDDASAVRGWWNHVWRWSWKEFAGDDDGWRTVIGAIGQTKIQDQS
ncbi:hypothetical protein SESBI_10268 [Sesbania bispinosa]|nr:hypothetical protein SESBI_10268 [Sesbania bispinosa]